MFGAYYPGSSYLGNDGFQLNPSTYSPGNTKLVSSLAGVVPAIRRGSLSISLSKSQGNCSFRVGDVRPAPFAALSLGLGSLGPADLIFRGLVQASAQSHEDSKANIIWTVTGVDSSAQFNRNLVWGNYIGVSASVIAADLLSRYAPEFTGVNIAPGLAACTISFAGVSLDAAFLSLATQIGGYYYRDLAYDVHLFITETLALTPNALDSSNLQLQTTPPLTWTANTAQIRNRVIGVGASVSLLSDVLSGETILPVAKATIFLSSGTALVGFLPLAYSSKVVSAGGTLIGPGATPSAAPAGVLIAGTGMGLGTYQIAYTDVTPSGESLPSPLLTITTTAIVAPVIPTIDNSQSGNMGSNYSIGDSVSYKITYTAAASFGDFSLDTLPSPGTAPVTIVAIIPVTSPALPNAPRLTITQSSDPLAKIINLWQQRNGGSYILIRSFVNTPGGAPLTINLSFDTNAPGFGTGIGAGSANYQQVSLSSIAIGASPTSSRKIYSTVVGGSQLKLLATLGDNTTLIYTDASADGSLGANAPTNDTSALTQPQGQINAGSITLLTAGAGVFSVTGGWAIVGNALIRYTGISGNTLTGIPPSGVGSILTTLTYNTQIVAASHLVLSAPLASSLLVGTPVCLYSRQDNIGSQAIVQGLEGGASTGVYEFKIADSSLVTQSSLDARCAADLLLFSDAGGIITVTYTTLDPKSAVGRPVAINIDGLVGTFIIQTVTISNIDEADNTPPRYNCTASSVRFSLDDLLRHLFLQ